MLQVEPSVLEVTYNWRWSHLSVIVDDTPDIIAIRNQLREVFDEAQTFEVVHVNGTRFHKGKVWGMKPKDRKRLRLGANKLA